MNSISGIDQILVDHFKPYRIETSNRFNLLHGVIVFVVPTVGGLVTAYFASQFVAANSGAFVAVYAVIASIMTAVMPTIHGLIGSVDRERIAALKTGSLTSDTNFRETRSLIAKVEIVRELYASVAWSVILLSLSLVPLLLVSHKMFQTDGAATPPVTISNSMELLRGFFVFLIGFIGATSFVALLQIVSGVHLMVRHSVIDVESDLRELKTRYRQ